MMVSYLKWFPGVPQRCSLLLVSPSAFPFVFPPLSEATRRLTCRAPRHRGRSRLRPDGFGSQSGNMLSDGRNPQNAAVGIGDQSLESHPSHLVPGVDVVHPL